MQTVILKSGRDKSLRRRHPWVFSQAIESEDKSLEPGSLVRVLSNEQEYLCTGFYNPHSQIRVRALSFTESEAVDDLLISRRIELACSLRQGLVERGNTGVRLVSAEGDLLPGLIVDRYADFVVISISTAGMERFKSTIIATLRRLFPNSSGYERSDTKSRSKEQLAPCTGVLWGERPPEIVYALEENTIRLPVNILSGHKTGAYLDQRDSRAYCATLSQKASVLNCFAYTGGFGLWALKGGARLVTNVDVSETALQIAKAGVAENHLDPGHCKFLRQDVFEFLRRQAEEQITYDVVILDPPKFAESQATLKKACRGYQDINRLALRLVRRGGHLLTFSCSGLMTPELFQKIVADAALDAQVDGRIVHTFRQSSDHLISLPCPETFYLKGLDILVC
ncbi:MAG: class I SAM-dependent methyltransferase [Succinivibrio sp.]|nr:class I SAM-dependent methyltransferase [Succinivibrio sp.]